MKLFINSKLDKMNNLGLIVRTRISNFIYGPADHFITGALNLVENKILKEILCFGFKVSWAIGDQLEIHLWNIDGFLRGLHICQKMGKTRGMVWSRPFLATSVLKKACLIDKFKITYHYLDDFFSVNNSELTLNRPITIASS